MMAAALRSISAGVPVRTQTVTPPLSAGMCSASGEGGRPAALRSRRGTGSGSPRDPRSNTPQDGLLHPFGTRFGIPIYDVGEAARWTGRRSALSEPVKGLRANHRDAEVFQDPKHPLPSDVAIASPHRPAGRFGNDVFGYLTAVLGINENPAGLAPDPGRRVIKGSVVRRISLRHVANLPTPNAAKMSTRQLGNLLRASSGVGFRWRDSPT